MASVKYYLRDKSTNPSALNGRLYYDGKEFVFATGYSIDPKYWNQKAQRVRDIPGRPGLADDINTFISERTSEIFKIHDALKREGRLTNENIKKRLAGETETKPDSLYSHIEKCIANRVRLDKRDRNGTDRTLSKYRTAYDRLKRFAEEKYKRQLDFSDIDLDFYNDYIFWLRSVPYAENTVGQYIKVLKRFLNIATVQGLNTKLVYKATDFKAPSKIKKHIYLDEAEINTLFDLELTGYLEKARDIFIIGCRTGLRVSDYDKCVSDAVEKTGLICIDETEKTGEPVYIPIHWQVKAVLDKYEGLPPLISDQKLNEYIKELCRIAGFDQRVKDTREGRHKPALSESEYCFKYELITTHTARRSCATNMYLAGFDLYFIQGILGHTKIEQTVKYLGVTRKLAAQKMLDNPYFKKNP